MKTLPALNTNHNQKVGITRRDFVKGLGSVIGLQLAWPLDSVFGQIVPNTCFVGAGVHGYSVAKELVHSFDDPEDAFAPSVFVFERDCSRIPEHVSAESIVVLCGAVEDEAFWRARDLIQEFKPHFLITMVPQHFRPAFNEAVVVLDHSQSVEHWLIPHYGLWLGMNYAEIKSVMAATTSNIIRYQAETLSTVQFKAFLKKNKGILNRCHRVYCYVSIVYPEEVEIEKFMAVLREAGSAEVLWEGHQVIRAGSRFEMQLVASRRIS